MEAFEKSIQKHVEIEHVLREIAHVQEVAVVAMKGPQDDNLTLYAAVCGSEKSLADIRTESTQQLPQYMLPKQLFNLANIPRSMHGKINRNQLKELIHHELESTGTISKMV